MRSAIDLAVRLQQTLEFLYRLESGPSVDDFRIGRNLFEHAVGTGGREQREALLVHHDGDETHLALFICEEVMNRAVGFLELHPHDGLDEFCVATEGVSHYVYFVFCGEQERPVSQIELELQAEIDKFIVLRALLNISGDALLAAMFDRASLASDLDAEERERYAVAHRAGRRYAKWLTRSFDRGEGARALEDARRLYRKSLPAKLEHISGS